MGRERAGGVGVICWPGSESDCGNRRCRTGARRRGGFALRTRRWQLFWERGGDHSASKDPTHPVLTQAEGSPQYIALQNYRARWPNSLGRHCQWQSLSGLKRSATPSKAIVDPHHKHSGKQAVVLILEWVELDRRDGPRGGTHSIAAGPAGAAWPASARLSGTAATSLACAS